MVQRSELEPGSHEVEPKTKTSIPTQKIEDAIVSKTLKAEAKKPIILSQGSINSIINEPLNAELIIAIDRQNFRNGVYKKIVKDMKSPISYLGDILWCRKLEEEERKAIRDYYDEAISIYREYERGEKDVSGFISQETRDNFMGVFLADAKKRETGIVTRTVKIYDDDGRVRGFAITYRDDTYDFGQHIKPGADRLQNGDAKWAAAVEFLEEKLKQKGRKKRTKKIEGEERAEYRTALRLEFDSKWHTFFAADDS